jgi:hypothetical protein
MTNKADILSIQDFISLKDIRIPEYQRPYKWGEKSVGQLLDDILTFKDKSHYRFGTIVIHVNTLTENNKVVTYNDIVDGQQRYTTLRLLIYALYENSLTNNNLQINTKSILELLKAKLSDIEIRYRHKASIEQINKNYQLIKRSIQQFDDNTIINFITKFQVVVFYITDETEAFQFFDSQNSRGKDLYPHDLLKAFHLREFDKNEIEVQTKIVDHWEKYQTKKLSLLFSNYLYRIKGWSNSKHARNFGKEDIDSFKGINIEKVESYPYVKSLQIAHHLVDNYNAGFERKIDKQFMNFPFQIDQIMINGRRFFEYVDYYLGINERFKKKYLKGDWNKIDQISNSELLVYFIYKNKFIYRDGESYLKDLFECLAIFYIDKFGENNLDEFIEKAFIYCYTLRFDYQRLGFDSVDNYVVTGNRNLFTIIKNAMVPNEVIKAPILKLPSLQQIELFSKTDSRRLDQEIVSFFKQRNYYEIK